MHILFFKKVLIILDREQNMLVCVWGVQCPLEEYSKYRRVHRARLALKFSEIQRALVESNALSTD